MRHHALKCNYCLLCIREGDEARRLGSVTMVVWTRVGPLTLTLCGECSKPVLKAANIIPAAVNEEPK